MVDTSNPVKQLNKNVELARDLGTPNDRLEDIANKVNQEIIDVPAPVRFAAGAAGNVAPLLKAAYRGLKDVIQDVTRDTSETPFDPVNNEQHKALFENYSKQFTPADPEFARLYTSDTLEEFESTISLLNEQAEKENTYRELGEAGTYGRIIGGFLDADLIIPIAKTKSAVQVARINSAIKAGKLDRATGIAALSKLGLKESKLSSIAENTAIGIVGGTAGAALEQEYDPSMDTSSLVHAALIGGTLGAGIGALTPTKSMFKNSDVTDAALDKAILDANNESVLKKESVLNDAINFTSAQEGGYVNNPNDMGGETIMGISKNNFPKEFSEIQALYNKDPRQAKKYQRKFFKGLFSATFDIDKLNANQIVVLQDTVDLFGQPRAKEFFRKANGDPEKIVALRKAHHAKVIKKDPTQAEFANGWENRNNALLSKIRGTYTTPSPEDRIREAIDARDSAYDAKIRNTYFTQDDLDSTPKIDLTKSVSAAGVSNTPDVVIPQSSRSLIEAAQDYIDNNELLVERLNAQDSFYAPEVDGVVAKATQSVFNKVYKAVSATPFQTDYDRLFNLKSDVAKMLAHKLLVDPLARVVNNKSGHSVAELIQQEVNTLYTPNAELHYKEWYKAQGLRRRDIIQYEFGARAKYERDLFLYREAINQGRTPPEVHESIKKASANLDLAYRKLLNYAKQYGVENFENIEFKLGHNPRSWNGHKIAKIESMPNVGTKKLMRSLQAAISAQSQGIDKQTSELYAKAIIRHAKNKQLGNPVGALGTVSDDGVVALQRIIMDERPSIDADEALEIAKSILYQNSDRGTLKSSRSRINLDTSYPILGTELTIADLLDQNTYELTTKLVRSQSNASALAYHGIQKRDLPQYKQAIIDEVNSYGGNAKEAAEIFDNIISYFGDGAYAGGSGVIANRINKIGRLAYLGQMGLSQVAELGATLGAVGIKSWFKFAGASTKAMLSKTEPELMKGLLSSEKYVGDASLIYRGQRLDDVNNYYIDASNISSFRDLMKYVMDKDEAGNLNIASKVGGIFDTTTDRLSVAQGVLSGFDKINQMIQMTAALSLQDLIVRAVKNGEDTARLRSMGVDEELRSVINKHITIGNIKFDESGSVVDMGVENWDFEEQELLRLVNRRNVDQAVQKAARGETQYWTYQTLGSIFSNLKSFVYTATHKQLLRNARLADPESFMLLLATLGTGGIVYSAKQIINGNSDNLTAENIASGAVQWSNITSPIYGAVDPLAYMLGVSGGNFRDFSGGTFTIPAGVTAAYSLANLPRVVGRPIVQTLSGEDISLGKVEKDALKVLPLNRALGVPQIIKILEED